jgi:DNA-directed RNA polymerase subunit RPC12/RpoP
VSTEPLPDYARETCRDCGAKLEGETAKRAGICSPCLFRRL